MPELAITISSYRLHDFVRLGLAQLRKLDPDIPLLVSDDPSQETELIKKAASDYGADYFHAKVRRGHFAGDFQAIVNSLVFAEAMGADVAVKVSQRFVFRKKESIDAIKRTFEDSNIMAATPGRPRVIPNAGKAAKGFGQFSILTDVVAIRVGSISPKDLLTMYRARLLRETVPWASFVECTIDELHTSKFPGKTAKIEEITNPTSDPVYLRRYQAVERQYMDLAMEHGLAGIFPLNEWNSIENRNYMCKPVVI